MTCSFPHDDAAYVLGALSANDRLRFEEHLRDCERCTLAVRELAGLPGLLGRVDATALEDPLEIDLVPGTLLPTLAREVRRRERRRTFAVAAAAAAVAGVVGLGASFLDLGGDEPGTSARAGQSPSGVTPQPMKPVGDVPVKAALGIEKVTWGTRLTLTCTYDTALVTYELPPVVDYVLVVRTSNGRTEKVGSWRSVDGRTMRLTAGTAADPDQIASVEVRTTTGRVVLTRPA